LSWLVFTILSVMLIIFYKRIKPVEGLKFIDAEILCEIKKNQNVKILDIRDPMDFEKSHVPGAINIYVGRLPYVSKKEFDINDVIIIVSSSEYHIKKAARTLMKSGFYNFAGSLWIENEKRNCEEGRQHELCF